jgi:hypothetical protein
LTIDNYLVCTSLPFVCPKPPPKVVKLPIAQRRSLRDTYTPTLDTDHTRSITYSGSSCLLIKASPTTEGKGKASTDTLTAIGKFNEEMVAAGILLGGEGLRPTSEGLRVRFSALEEEVSVLNGPFDIKEQSTISGWWVIKVMDGEEALNWAKRIPFRGTQNAEVEIRRLIEMDDFDMTDEQKQREEALRAKVEGK